MVDVEQVTIPIEADASGVKAGVGEAKKEIEGLGSTSEQTAAKVNTSGAKMEGSYKSLALGMSQTMTSGFALYSAFDDIEKKEYALDKANLAAQKSTDAISKAQTDYDEAVKKYGPESDQALAAMDKLTVAQQQAELDTERASIAQGNLNDQMTMASLTVIPGVISGIEGMSKVWGNLKNLDIGGHLGGLTTALGTNKGALVSWGAGLGAVGVIAMAFTTSSSDMKVALSLLAGGLVAAAAAQWVYNAAAAFGIGLTGVGLALVAIAAAAAAAVYLMSSQYGAPVEAAPAASTDYSGSSSGSSSGSGFAVVAGSSGAGLPVSWNSDKTVAKHQAGTPISASESSYFEGKGFKFDNATQSWRLPGYASGGMAVTPQIATLAEHGEPEYIIPDSIMQKLGGGGDTYITNHNTFNVPNEQVANYLARKLSTGGI